MARSAGYLSLILLLILGLLAICPASAADKPTFDARSLEFFEKEIRPILVSRCYECHSNQSTSVKGGLRLDSRAAILNGGDTGPAVTLDDTAASLFLSAINYGDLYQMPPKSKLPASEIAVLTKWVQSGLPWPDEAPTNAGAVKPFNLEARAAGHWCWQRLKPTELPAVHDAKWPRSDIDQFILAKLESRKISPAQPADKAVLLRRLCFDLTGLPPSPAEVEEFVQDKDSNAYEKQVDRLLGSIHFGERWGRHWLDLVRYGETRGHEFDYLIPNAWQYRDYVIRALNSDVPYDRFLTEHLAGDLIEPRWRTSAGEQSAPELPINESPLGTGFWFLGEEVHSPVDIRKDETDRMDNRLDVLSKTFLGLTVACARCHDHKFDAISQRDYYALAGFAISGCYRQIRVDTDEQHRQIARKLDELRTKSRAEIAKLILASSRDSFEKLDQYWSAAKQTFDEIASAPALPEYPPASKARLAKTALRFAEKNSLDAARLHGWCQEFIKAQEDTRHPLHGLFDVPADEDRGSPHAARPLEGIVADFADLEPTNFIQAGVSFGLQPVKQGELVFEESQEWPIVRIATNGGWKRDLFWKEISLSPGTEVDSGTIGSFRFPGRMIRTPEFTLKSAHLWYLVRGSVNVYANVNSHLLIHGPLHGSLLRVFEQKDDRWHWVDHPMEAYQGHRMHIEFSPADKSSCMIGMVVQSNDEPELPEPELLVADSRRTWQQNATAFINAIRDAVDKTLTPPSESSNNHQRSARQIALADWFMTHLPLFSNVNIGPIVTAQREAEAELARQVRWDSSLAPAMLEANGVDEFLLVRGNSNTPKEPVSRRFLEVFQGVDHLQSGQARPQDPSQADRKLKNHRESVVPGHGRQQKSGRLELSQEILRSPLASRVMVNRIWYHLFGRGIVPTVDNMGSLGLPPSHPELLDYLAAQFVQEGWSVKRMIRSLVLSQTYRMSSRPTEADEVDPDNLLWHRMPIKRLEGEAIRDALLTVSGRINRKASGPSVPIHLTEFMEGRGRPKNSGPLDSEGRRSIYIAVRRNFLSPMMLAFDTPSPFSTVGRRTNSNVPAQALILMNDAFVIEQARLFAERLLADQSQSIEQRLGQLYLAAFARRPSIAEVSVARQFLNAQIQNQPENEHDAWSHLCHVMFNVKEFVFID